MFFFGVLSFRSFFRLNGMHVVAAAAAATAPPNVNALLYKQSCLRNDKTKYNIRCKLRENCEKRERKQCTINTK